ncbi:hypothetical protein L1999_10275 [Neobacillus drentensis]|nr:hypothetical protein [Neobacillus drentensis]ULT58880.1 hypothetical protein L1999_10275 [Neobacillus drentensis]
MKNRDGKINSFLYCEKDIRSILVAEKKGKQLKKTNKVDILVEEKKQ